MFVEDGSYGQRGYLFKWAKARGMVTAELQHGFVSENHPAYNYGKGILSSSVYKEYLPDYVLTYGSYWNERMNTASKKVVIGNPNLSEHRANAASQWPEKARQVILIISGGANPEGMKQIAIDLARIIDHSRYQVILRPHPGELPWVRERYGQLESSGASIDVTSDLYDALLRATFVAGEVSTVLFEALHFGKVAFAMDHPYTLLHIGSNTLPIFKTASDIASLVAQKQFHMPASNLFWAADWQVNYETFIGTAFHRENKRVNESGLEHPESPESQESFAGV